MPGSEARKRIAVIIPKNRIWSWHQKAISAIEKNFDVDVYTNLLAPRYPPLLRLWISIERRLLGHFSFANVVKMPATSSTYVENGKYLLVLNLSEVPIVKLGIPILEVRFGKHLDSLSLIATLMARKNPYLSICEVGNDEPFATSYLATQDKAVLLRGLQSSFARTAMLIERAMKWQAQGSHAGVLPKPPMNPATFSTIKLLLFAARFFLSRISGRLLRLIRRREHWSVALRYSNEWRIPHGVPLREFHTIPDDGRRFYADPFLFSDNSQQWLFVEEFEYRANKGVISCTKIIGNGKCGQPFRVLERSYHLSYPFLFRHDNEMLMIPETGSNRSVELYHARSFPTDWVLRQTLISDIELYDATLLQYKGRWWLFAAIVHDAGSAQDELAIFHSVNLEGPWEPHRLNPVKSDCRSARPAGHIIVDNGRLLRPAQDCEEGYGTGLVWLEIEELTPERFREREIARWPGNAIRGVCGIHTFNRDQMLGAIDAQRKIWKTSSLPTILMRTVLAQR